MELTFTPEQDALRAEIREWLAANVPPQKLPSLDTKDGFALHREWERKLHDAGWGVVNWPKEYGGQGMGVIDWLIFEEE